MLPNNNDAFTFIIDITNKCNLKCLSCFSFCDTATNLYEVPLEQIKQDITDIRRIFTDRRIVDIEIFGGEPILHSQIVDICKFLRECFPRKEIRLATNGVLFLNIPDTLIQQIAEYKIKVCISYYPIPNVYQSVTDKINQNYGIVCPAGTRYYLNKPPVNQKLKRNCQDLIDVHTQMCVNNGYLYPCILALHKENTTEKEGLKISEIQDTIDFTSFYSIKSYCKDCPNCDAPDFIPWQTIKDISDSEYYYKHSLKDIFAENYQLYQELYFIDNSQKHQDFIKCFKEPIFQEMIQTKSSQTARTMILKKRYINGTIDIFLFINADNLKQCQNQIKIDNLIKQLFQGTINLYIVAINLSQDQEAQLYQQFIYDSVGENDATLSIWWFKAKSLIEAYERLYNNSFSPYIFLYDFKNPINVNSLINSPYLLKR